MAETEGGTPVTPTAPTEPTTTTEAKAPESLMTDPPPAEKPEPPTDSSNATNDDAKPDAPKPDPAKVFDKAALKAPEGMELDAGMLEKFEPIAKELGLTTESAQKLVDFHMKTIQDVAGANQRAFEELQKTWIDKVKADPQMGDTNGLRPEVKKVVADALARYGDDETRQALAYTGAGNNPAIVRTFFKMARALSEGGMIAGGTPSRPTGPGASAMYPELKAG